METIEGIWVGIKQKYFQWFFIRSKFNHNEVNTKMIKNIIDNVKEL